MSRFSVSVVRSSLVCFVWFIVFASPAWSDDATKQILQKLERIEQRLGRIEASLAGAEAKAAQVRLETDEADLAPAELIQELVGLREALADHGRSLGDRHPTMARLRALTELLETQIAGVRAGEPYDAGLLSLRREHLRLTAGGFGERHPKVVRLKQQIERTKLQLAK